MTSIGDLETSLHLQNYENSKILKREAEAIKLHLPTNEQSVDELFLALQVDRPQGLNFYEQREHLSKQIALYPAKKQQLETLLVEMKDRLNTETVSATEETDFYTPASDALVSFRLQVMAKHLELKKRVLDARRAYVRTQSVSHQIQQRRSVLSKLDNYSLNISATGSTRPISAIKLQDQHVYFSTWNGEVKKYDIANDTVSLIYEHAGKVSALDVHKNMIVSGSTDNNIKVCTMSETGSELQIISGHLGRVSKTKWLKHFENHFISASYDKTWKLWDLNRKADLLTQEGHDSEISSLSSNKYNSLVCSGSLDGVGLIWDVRSGSKLCQLQHTKAIHCSAWTWNDSPITGSADGSIHVWDLRKPNDPSFTIPAHTNIVTDLVLDANDQYLVSTSYDKNINVYSCGNWVKSSTLEGSLDKSLCLDVSDNQIVAGGWDRSVKIWS